MKLLIENWRKFLLRESNIINGVQLGLQVHASQETVEQAIKRFESHKKLSSFQDPSRKKPFAFYTSTLKDLGNDIYNSSWNEFLNSSDGRGVRNSISAFILKPQQNAKILDIKSVEDYENIFKQFPSADTKKIDWNKVAENYHGIHFEENVARQIGFDVEQTAWFDTSILQVTPARNEQQINQKIIKMAKEELSAVIKQPSSYQLLGIYSATLNNDLQKKSKEFRDNLIQLVQNFVKNTNSTLDDLFDLPQLPNPFYEKDIYTPNIIETIEYFKYPHENIDFYDLKYNLISNFSSERQD